MISELRLATFGVADLDRTRRFYAEAFLYEVKGEGVVDVSDPMTARGWALPAGMTARFAVMGPPGLATGLIRLVQFSQPGEQIWRDYSRPGDFGLFAANIRVSTIGEGWARLQAAGARARGLDGAYTAWLSALAPSAVVPGRGLPPPYFETPGRDAVVVGGLVLAMGMLGWGLVGGSGVL